MARGAKPKDRPSLALELALAKLGTSGLDAADLAALKLKVWEGPETAGIDGSFPAVPSLEFPYLDPFNKWAPLAPKPKWPPVRRFRLLQEVKRIAGRGPLRYVQPEGTGVCAYFPPSVDWAEIARNPAQTVLITEGELKAAKATKEGFPTIGLGGVWSFRSAALRCPFLPELEKINWAQRKVVIAYDSDVTEKDEVSGALNALATELMDRGALPSLLLLPPLPPLDPDSPPRKCGLDDWFVANAGPDVHERFRRMVEHSAQDMTLARPLYALNDEVVLCREPHTVVELRTGRLMSPEAFKNSLYANRKVHELKMRDGELSMAPVSAGKAWLEWPLRREVQGITFAPGESTVFDHPVTGRCFNSWRGWGTTPAKGDVSLYLKLVDHLFSQVPKETKEWFLRWCAYPIQHPGAKLYSACAVHGVKQGTGKSFLFYCLRRIYGQHFAEIKQRDLEGSFTSWAKDKQFVMGDDVTGSDQRAHADALKALVTQKEMRINIKFIPDYTVPACANFAFTSNQPDAFFIEDDDRRFFVHEVAVDPLPPAFYHDLEEWLESEAGGNALHYYLLHYPLGDFDHRERALDTAAKRSMIALGKSDLAGWVDQLVGAPDTILKLGQAPIAGDLFSARELLQLYDPLQNKRVTANGLARALTRAQVPRACAGDPVRWERGQDRYYIVRNRNKWAAAKAAEVRAHLSQTK